MAKERICPAEDQGPPETKALQRPSGTKLGKEPDTSRMQNKMSLLKATKKAPISGHSKQRQIISQIVEIFEI